MAGIRRETKSGYVPWVRADERRSKERLRNMDIRPKTLAHYKKAVSPLSFFAIVFYGGVAGCMDLLDAQAREHFECLWECGDGGSRCPGDVR